LTSWVGKKRWGLEVYWGSVTGAVAFRDPITKERIEVEGKWLRSDNPRTDLRWMLARAARRAKSELEGSF